MGLAVFQENFTKTVSADLLTEHSLPAPALEQLGFTSDVSETPEKSVWVQTFLFCSFDPGSCPGI